jgi:hypothetical protein
MKKIRIAALSGSLPLDKELRKDDYCAFNRMVTRILSCETVYQKFFCAKVVHKQFELQVKKIERDIKVRTVPFRYEQAYQDLYGMFRQAIDCSEKIHTELCTTYTVSVHTKSKKSLQKIIECWSNTHVRLWRLMVEKDLV